MDTNRETQGGSDSSSDSSSCRHLRYLRQPDGVRQRPTQATRNTTGSEYVVGTLEGKTKFLEMLVRTICGRGGEVPDIIMWQETNITTADLEHMQLPEGWIAAAQMKLIGHMKGNTILVGTGGVLASRNHVVEVEDISNVAFDLKALRVRDLTIISVYVHCVREKGRSIRSSISALMSTLEETLTGREAPCIIAGDFNTSTEKDREHLVDMMDAFGVMPSLPQGGHCRPTHAKGGALDWIFSRSMTSSVLHIDEEERIITSSLPHYDRHTESQR